VNIGNNLRIDFRYIIQKIAAKGNVPLSIVRGGKVLKIELPVSSDHPMLISNLQGSYPDYFIYGPLVFSTATSQFIGNINSTGTNSLIIQAFLRNPLIARFSDKPAFPGEELVVVSSPFFLTHWQRVY